MHFSAALFEVQMSIGSDVFCAWACLCAPLCADVQSNFGRPAGAMSLNSPSTTRRRRRHGSTSPPLVCVEKNPGPGQKKRGRKTRKDHQPLDHHLGEDEKKELKVLFDQGLGVNEIVRTTHMKEDTVVRCTCDMMRQALWKHASTLGRRAEATQRRKPRPHSRER